MKQNRRLGYIHSTSSTTITISSVTNTKPNLCWGDRVALLPVEGIRLCAQHVAWFPGADVAVSWQQKVRVPVGLTVVLLALEAWVCSGKPGCHTLPPCGDSHLLWDTLVCTWYDGMCWQQTTHISGTHWSVHGMTECADSRPLPSSLGHAGLYTVWRNVLTADHSHLWGTLVCTRYDGMCWQQTTPIFSGTRWSVHGMTECADSRPLTSLGTLVCTRYDRMCWKQTTRISGTHLSTQRMTECADSRPLTSLGHTGLYTVWRNVLTADHSHLWKQAHLSMGDTLWCKEMNKYRKHGVCPRWSQCGAKRWTNTENMASVQGDHSVVQRDEQIQKAWRLSKVITVWCKEMNKYRKHGVCPRRSQCGAKRWTNTESMASVQGDHSVVQRDEQIQKAWRLSKVITVWCKEMNKYRKHGVCPRRSQCGAKRWTNTESMASVQGHQHFNIKTPKIKQDMCCLGKSGRLLGCYLPAGNKEMSNDYLCCETPLSSKPMVWQSAK